MFSECSFCMTLKRFMATVCCFMSLKTIFLKVYFPSFHRICFFLNFYFVVYFRHRLSGQSFPQRSGNLWLIAHIRGEALKTDLSLCMLGWALCTDRVQCRLKYSEVWGEGRNHFILVHQYVHIFSLDQFPQKLLFCYHTQLSV